MKKPVQVAGAVLTSGLLFWPAHAEAPAADAWSAIVSQMAMSALPLHEVRTTSDRPAGEQLRVLAQYTEEKPLPTEENDEAAAEEDTSDDDDTSTDDGADGATDNASGTEDGSDDDEEPASEIITAEDAADAEAADGEADIAGEDATADENPFGELEASDAVNEVPVSTQPEATPTTWAPEEGERAAEGAAASEAAGDDSRVKFKLSTGFDYSSGDYGTDFTTDILYIPVSGQIDTRSWKFKLTVPYIRIDGLSSVVGGTDGGEPLDPSDTSVDDRGGLGDVVAAVTYKVPPLGEGAPFIDLTGKVKFPTADRDEFLGTGEFDYTFQADIFQAFGDLTLFGTIGYRILGDVDPEDAPPAGRELNNGVLASGGIAYKFSETFSGGGILDWREAATDANDDPFEVVPYVVWKVHPDWAVQAYGVFGLSDGSPDAGGGLQISVTFD